MRTTLSDRAVTARVDNVVCCWCNEQVWGGRLVEGRGYLLRPCLHVSYPRDSRRREA